MPLISLIACAYQAGTPLVKRALEASCCLRFCSTPPNRWRTSASRMGFWAAPDGLGAPPVGFVTLGLTTRVWAFTLTVLPRGEAGWALPPVAFGAASSGP